MPPRGGIKERQSDNAEVTGNFEEGSLAVGLQEPNVAWVARTQGQRLCDWVPVVSR